jgi:hypothetical protein
VRIDVLYPWRIIGAGLALAVILCSTAHAAAQVTPDPAVIADYRAAAELVLSQNPITAAAIRVEGYRTAVWAEVGFVSDRAPELDPKLLVDIKDGRTLPRIDNRLKKEIPREDMAIYLAYSDALAKAFHTPLDAFRKSAEDNRNVTFAQLWATPERYRGKVIPIKGRLVMLRRWDPPIPAQQQGVKDLYEGWIFGPTRRANPFSVVFPVLPAGLEEAEQMNEEVTFYGYFLTKFKYRAGDGKDQVTPLLIGPTVVVDAKAARTESETPFALIVLGLVLGGLLAMTVLFLVMSLWFRRGDARLRQTLHRIHEKHNPPSFLDEPAGGEKDTRIAPVPRALPVSRPDGTGGGHPEQN